MTGRLKGKICVVTGATRGIGRGCAIALAEEGATIYITGRSNGDGPLTLKDSVAAIEQAGGVGIATQVDHANDHEIEAFFKKVAEEAGHIDILVNNAATNPYAGPMIDADLPRWEKTIDVNMTAPFLWTQTVWQKYQKDNGGVILNIASVGGLETNPMLGVYDVTKAGLIHMTKQFAAELAPQVRVNAICPGLIKTDFARMLWEGDGGDMVAQQYPLRRLGEVEDIAAAALYLAADSGSWITGQAMVLDGGGQIKF